MTKNTKVTKTRIRTSETKLATIAEEYGLNLGVKSDMKLGTYLKKRGFPSLAKMLENAEN